MLSKPVLLCVLAAASLSTHVQAAMVLIDFGIASTPTPSPDSLGRFWANVDNTNDQSVDLALIATTGDDSGYRLTISNLPGVTNPVGFNGANENGTTTPTGEAALRGYPATATRDSLYGNTAV